MSVGQPVVQGHETDFRAVADEQEYERQRQHRGLELGAHVVELGPQQRAAAGTEEPFRSEVEQDSAEQRLRDPHTAQDEVFPSRFEARRRTVQRLSLIHISEPTRLLSISYAVFCLKKKKQKTTKA